MNRYELKYHGFVDQFGYDVWEVLEDGASNGTLYPNRESAQKQVDFYNDNNITRKAYRDLCKSDPEKALKLLGQETYEKLKHLLEV